MAGKEVGPGATQAKDYPVRYVAYVDILGFRRLIEQLDRDPNLLTSLRELLAKAHTPEPLDQFWEDADFKFTTISDAIALSTSVTPGGLRYIFNTIEQLARDLLELGYFLRGAIVKDRLFHDNQVVIGAGLVRAYTLENTIAKYPRIIVTKSVFDDTGWESTDAVDMTYAHRSKDGPYFLHVLRFLERIKMKKAHDRESMIPWINRIGAMVQTRLDEAVDDPAHYEKVFWFAEYFNEIFSGVEGVQLVVAPGLQRAAVWG